MQEPQPINKCCSQPASSPHRGIIKPPKKVLPPNIFYLRLVGNLFYYSSATLCYLDLRPSPCNLELNTHAPRKLGSRGNPPKRPDNKCPFPLPLKPSLTRPGGGGVAVYSPESNLRTHPRTEYSNIEKVKPPPRRGGWRVDRPGGGD